MAETCLATGRVMIIRHDLRLVFLHVPKCAGKALRKVFQLCCQRPDDLETLWNYSFNDVLQRYVDQAHLPLSDLKTYAQFELLDTYTVVACIRHPYSRLRSAVNEYYRQKSPRHEELVKQNSVTAAMQRRYFRQIERRHAELDPRFIHSLPIHRFTHFGHEPKVDHLLRCESLRTDFQVLANALCLPTTMQKAARDLLKSNDDSTSWKSLTQDDLELAQRLYADDLNCFGYGDGAFKPAATKCVDAGRAKTLHGAAKVSWHWGPHASRSQPQLKPTR